MKRRRLRPAGQKRVEASEMTASAQVMLDATGGKCNRKNSFIWFSLVASEDQKGDVPLPQISVCYLRIKDGTVPVSFIQKYLVKKLNHASEAEVHMGSYARHRVTEREKLIYTTTSTVASCICYTFNGNFHCE